MPLLPPVPWLHSAPQVPAGRGTGDREIICQPLAKQPGDSVPAPRLLQGITAPGTIHTPPVPVLPIPVLVRSGSRREMSPARQLLPGHTSDPGTDLNVSLCTERSAQAAQILLHPPTLRHPTSPSPYSANLAVTCKKKPKAAIARMVQPRNRKGSREQGTLLNSGCLLQIPAAQEQLLKLQQHFFISCGTRQRRQQKAAPVCPTQHQPPEQRRAQAGQARMQPGAQELKAVHPPLLPSLFPHSQAT